MTDTEDPTRALGEALSAAAAVFSREMTKVAASLSTAMNEWKASPAGKYVISVANYYERHPGELDAMIAAREAEARTRYCDCMCGRWKHRGACTTRATVNRMFSLDGEPVVVPLCSSCASSIDAQRPLVPGGPVSR